MGSPIFPHVRPARHGKIGEPSTPTNFIDRPAYFAFYVIEHYIDDSYRFAGLSSFARYLWEKRSKE